MKQVRECLLRIQKDLQEYKGFLLVFLLYDIIVQLCFRNFCPAVILTGLPCPGCGMTRAVFYFLTGQVKKGWVMNPLGIGWAVLAVYFVVMRYWLGRKPVGLLQGGGILTVCMAVLYIYRMYSSFPGEVPIMYTQENLFAQIVPGYQQWIEKLTAVLVQIRAL